MISAILASLLTFHYINQPVVDMRKMPHEGSQVVSQAIFAQEVDILETQGDWVKISIGDECPGWVEHLAIQDRQEPYADCSCVKPLLQINQLAAPLYPQADTASDPLLILPFESRLEILDDSSKEGWIEIVLLDESRAYIQEKDVIFDTQLLTKAETAKFSLYFLNLPYVSGGRSSFGYDSAGFIQMLYRQMGFDLPRLCQEQYSWEGFAKIDKEALEEGDLIFWAESESVIAHVGMYIGQGRYIHVDQTDKLPSITISDLSRVQEERFCQYRQLNGA